MDEKSNKPLDTGQRVRRKGRLYSIPKRMRCIFQNRPFLLAVIWMVKIVAKIARLASFFGDF